MNARSGRRVDVKWRLSTSDHCNNMRQEWDFVTAADNKGSVSQIVPAGAQEFKLSSTISKICLLIFATLLMIVLLENPSGQYLK
jgi:hypothetical protein